MKKFVSLFLLAAGFSAVNIYMFVDSGKPLNAAAAVFSGLAAIFVAILSTKATGEN